MKIKRICPVVLCHYVRKCKDRIYSNMNRWTFLTSSDIMDVHDIKHFELLCIPVQQQAAALLVSCEACGGCHICAYDAQLQVNPNHIASHDPYIFRPSNCVMPHYMALPPNAFFLSCAC